MAIETQKFIRKPLYVDAVRITPQNFDAIVAWCQGEVMQDDVPGRGRSKKYIKVDVHNPKNPRQTKAKLGDWILKTEKGYKIYTDKAFHESFHLPEEDPRGDQEALEEQRMAGMISPDEEVVPGVTVGEALHLLKAHAKLQDEVGPDVELVPATPEAIAQAVNENDAARAENLEKIAEGQVRVQEGIVDADAALGQTEREKQDEIRQALTNAGAVMHEPGRTEEKIADAVEPTPTRSQDLEEPTVEVDGGVSVNDTSSAPPPVHNGKRVLTLQEQGEMDSDEIRELIQSGEVILAQDIAA